MEVNANAMKLAVAVENIAGEFERMTKTPGVGQERCSGGGTSGRMRMFPLVSLILVYRGMFHGVIRH